MAEIIFIICMALICLRILSSIDKQKELEIMRLRKEIKRLGGNCYEQRFNNNQSNRNIYNSNKRG